jgi:tetratricopeptide (TPR) repeat protein
MSPASSRSRAALLLPALLILAAGLWVYWPALHGGWVWDDVEEVTQNAVLRDPAGLARIWTAPAGADYFPLKTTVQWVEWRCWGDAPLGYHAVSIALHLLSALLFWRVLRQLDLRLGWVGGLLFAVHPVAVESVAWAAELKNTLSLALLLPAMILYLDFDQKGSGRECLNPAAGTQHSRPDPFYWTSLLFFVLALLSKTSVVMFPAVILLHAWWKRDRVDRRDLRASAPFFAASLGLGLVTLWFQHHRAIIAGHEFAGSPATRLLAAGRALAFYLEKSLVPVGLLPIYPRWEIDPGAPLQYAPWLAGAALFWLLWRRRAAWGRAALFGLGFFVLNLLPVLGLVGMAYLRISRVADHFAYLPLLGLIGLGVAALDRLPGAARWSAVAVAGLLLAWQGRAYAENFRDETTLWTYTLERNPRAWAAHNNLGFALFQAGRIPEAIAHYREALRLQPDFAEARYNLGTALLRTNQVAPAIAEYEAALRLQPASAAMHNNLATALAESGRMPEAIAHFEQAVRLEPDYADAHHNLGNAYLLSRRLPEAIREYEAALRLRPDDASARSALEMAQRVLRKSRGS